MALRRLGIVGFVWIMVMALLTVKPDRVHAVDVTLIWTTPGDDGVIGPASYYDLRYSTQPITESNFYSCEMYPDVPRPLDPGTLQAVVIRGLEAGRDYYFALKTADERGNWSRISNVAIHSGTAPLAAGDGPVPFAFDAPRPNPARLGTAYSMSLPVPALATVEAFDLTGRRVRTLLDGLQPAGQHVLSWDLRDDSGMPVRPGVYLVRAVVAGRTFKHRTVVVR